ncbi:LytR family transcriptional regulator, partial [Barnesiella sp. GGCC_0306]|nr:LytR family transcriptional regulator [Barnesiella sp. GGCC_0306]
DQALILCRSRHTYDEYGSGDYYRMANQRMVMGAIAKKILASDVVTMANTINAMADYITTDMDVQSIVS